MRFWIALLGAAAATVWYARIHPFPPPDSYPWLWLIHSHSPVVWAGLVGFHYLTPALWVTIGLRFLWTQRDIWMAARTADFGRGSLPPWPLHGREPLPAIVVGELHHPTEKRETRRPRWLVLPAKGLYTGTAVFGAVGSGKTTAAIMPWTRQLLAWQAADPDRRCAALVLEVKGSMCPMVEGILREHGRSGDWVEIGLGPKVRYSWNPLCAPEIDSFSLAYQIATLLNQLYGKGKEPFWQQAYTNVLRNVIELFRIDPLTGGWVTLADLNERVVSRDGIGRKIEEVAARLQATVESDWVRITRADLLDHAEQLANYLEYEEEKIPSGPPVPWSFADETWADCVLTARLERQLDRAGVTYEVYQKAPAGKLPHPEAGAILEEVHNWYCNDWMELDEKTRSNVIEGISIFLGMFVHPDVKRVLCPPPPLGADSPRGEEDADLPAAPGERAIERVLTPLPPMRRLIESGKVLGMNLPSSTSPGLARVLGVMLKQAWLQAAMQRAADMGSPTEEYPEGFFFRPALFLCDEYHMFATVGASDPCGDEKAFALTRESRVMPVIATQSISSLKSATSGDSYRTLLQTLRTKVFLSLSDDESCNMASKLCGKAERIRKSTSVTENLGSGGVSFLTGRAGGAKGSVGTSYSYNPEFREIFSSRDFAELALNEGICLPFDGTASHPATRVYLKPSYRDREEPYFRWRETLADSLAG